MVSKKVSATGKAKEVETKPSPDKTVKIKKIKNKKSNLTKSATAAELAGLVHSVLLTS